jgi:hypothetical protein
MRYEGTDRRRYPRSKRGFPVVVDESGPGVLNHVDNISTNGVLCHTVKPIALMTKMSMALVVPKPEVSSRRSSSEGTEEHRIECEGIVVRCDRHESGDDHFKVAILFTNLSEDVQEAIMEFVEHDLQSHPQHDD